MRIDDGSEYESGIIELGAFEPSRDSCVYIAPLGRFLPTCVIERRARRSGPRRPEIDRDPANEDVA